MAAAQREVTQARKEESSFMEGVTESLVCDRCQQPIDGSHKKRHPAMLTSARESAEQNHSVAAKVSFEVRSFEGG